MQNFIKRVREYYKKYYDLNDEAHRIDHADSVCEEALFIMDVLKININKRMVVVAAYTHDIFCNVNRKTHNILASKYVLDAKDDEILNEFSGTQRLSIAEAVLQHRSSYKGERSNILSRIIATADIGRVNLKDIILRSYKYHSGDGKSDIKVVDEIYEHLIDKFSSNGYRKYDEFYMSIYGDIVNDFKKEVDKITKEDIIKVIEE